MNNRPKRTSTVSIRNPSGARNGYLTKYRYLLYNRPSTTCSTRANVSLGLNQEKVMQKFITLLFALFFTASATQAQTAPPLPQVTPPITTQSCIGDWYVNMSETRQIDLNGGRYGLNQSGLQIRITGATMDSNGNVSCSGKVTGIDGSSANLWYYPANGGQVQMYFYIPVPEMIFSGGNQMYTLELNFTMFVQPRGGQYFFGTMSAVFGERTLTGNMKKILYHGDADLSKDNGAKGRPMPSQ